MAQAMGAEGAGVMVYNVNKWRNCHFEILGVSETSYIMKGEFM